MAKGECPKCKRIVIENLEEYIEKYPDEKEVQCPYCLYMMRLK
jgi:DNA-directed RNA polymerase subunit RPC12/RpoP